MNVKLLHDGKLLRDARIRQNGNRLLAAARGQRTCRLQVPLAKAPGIEINGTAKHTCPVLRSYTMFSKCVPQKLAHF